MKKILAILLSMVFLTSSVVYANAAAADDSVGDSFVDDFDELTPREKLSLKFSDYYKHKEHGIIPSALESFLFFKPSYNGYVYGLTKFISPNALQTPYYNRIGANEEYFEYSDVTNWQFPSGMAVFYGLSYYVEGEESIFLTLAEIAETKPEVFDRMIYETENYYTVYTNAKKPSVEVDNRYIGRVGDADGDCTVSITDATEIQKYLAGLTTLTGARLKAAEIDNQEVSINTATQIQLYLAEMTDKL